MSLSIEERLKLADIDPELAEVLKTAKFPEIDYSDPAKVITGLRAYMKSQHKPADPESGVSERDIHYTARDGFELRARVYEPATKSESSTLPLVVYIHGGGWTIGSPEDAAVACRNLVKELGVVCIAPSYRQGPEDPFPAGINDFWDGLQWLDTHAETELGVSLSRGFVVGGSSAGGNMTAVASHLARDKPLSNPITGLFLLAPMILPPEAAGELPPKYAESYKSRTQPECKKDPVLSPELEKIFHDSAKGDTQSALFVPFIWPTGHGNLPKTYFQVCGMDILRDEALIYEQVLREQGVETRLDVYPGMPHIFWNTFSRLTQGRKAADDLRNGVKWLLE